MSGPKRTIIGRSRKELVTPQMLDLFARGLVLVAGDHDHDDDQSPEHEEFNRIEKKLGWSLIGIQTVSVFDREIMGPPPAYMQSAVREDWLAMQAWRKALLAALAARGKAR
ncbi:hypothetical protein [Bradyrhizobium sp. Leo170]|uniref:hypothetical protein n=1 Tax=Bradyrhizobium sp. Leo170 TaxID=1571199 RepID=UPI00102EC809|nr:hypothetical protein [Bradyrhizobium sp. Leo170]TAI65699.1 hypothetical protein CWO89_12215 [Bradyrhizobium sp. Leo170]